VYNGHRNGLGFRDTVQDILAVLPAIPEEARERLEIMLSGQFENGGALPVVKPFDHKPGKTPMIPAEEFRSDDCLWFFNTVPAYVAETGNVAFYDKVVPYADKGQATVFGHLRRALEFNLERCGKNGLPCGLAADWNDCLKLGYHGESLFVAFQVRFGLDVYADIARKLGKPDEAKWADAKKAALDQQIQKHCWSKDRFIWAIAQDGTVYGTHESKEGAVYLNTQVWAVLSGAATPEQAKTCMETLNKNLATEYGVMLCAPPVLTMDIEVMKARLFNAGCKENSGIFNHPQGWVVMAECLLGNGNRAYDYNSAYMPSKFNDKAEVREIEPYVHNQSTHAPYSPKFGAARLPWLTGAAAWAYYSMTAYILGIRAEMEGLRIDPCVPAAWKGFKATRVFRGKKISINVTNPASVQRGVKSITVNGQKINGTLISAEKLADGCAVEVVMG
jgi:cellobiose phosphorylase